MRNNHRLGVDVRTYYISRDSIFMTSVGLGRFAPSPIIAKVVVTSHALLKMHAWFFISYTSSTDSPSSPVALIGGVVGGVLGLVLLMVIVLLLVGICFFVSRGKGKSSETAPMSSSD